MHLASGKDGVKRLCVVDNHELNVQLLIAYCKRRYNVYMWSGCTLGI